MSLLLSLVVLFICVHTKSFFFLQMRLAMVSSPSFQQLCQYHCLTAGIRHSAPPAEFESTVKSKAGNANISMDMLRGYQRLPYDIKSKIVTGLIVGCSETSHEPSNALLNDCLKAIHDVFSSLVHVLSYVYSLHVVLLDQRLF